MTRDYLRRLEARLDARLQQINARIVLHDGRFAAIGDRINQTDRRCDALGARVDSRLRSIGRRFDGVETRLDHVAAQLSSIGNGFAAIRDQHDTRWWQLRRRPRHLRPQ